jgi:hypothetical protein
MLRIRVQRRTGAVTNGISTITHGLGVTLDFWAICPTSNRGFSVAGGWRRWAANYPNGTHLWVANAVQTHCTADFMCIAYQGRLY